MQPCCRERDIGAEPRGSLVVGLVESQAMLDASLAISPVLVLAGVVLVIALLVGWSFLKVALIGSQQRVTRIDVLQLGASAIFGLALATILLLTSSTYAQAERRRGRTTRPVGGSTARRVFRPKSDTLPLS